MLKQLKIENFTVFAKADFEFSPGLNVIVGENGTGKSHVLKLAYAILAANDQERKKPNIQAPTKTSLQKLYANKLMGVMKAENLGNLVAKKTNGKCTVEYDFDDERMNCVFGFSRQSKSNVEIDVLPTKWYDSIRPPVFFPPRELMTLYPGFVSVYESYILEYEETYRDTCVLLGRPVKLAIAKPLNLEFNSPARIKETIDILESILDGRVELSSNGRFYLIKKDGEKTEMFLVAEGHRKIAMLAQLLVNGSLGFGGYLFWDEPEANLNPRIIKKIAKVIMQLASRGIQVFIATHSLFLLRELEVLQAAEKKPVPQRYFALKQTAEGVEVEQGNTVEDLQTLVLLDEELQQSDRYMALEQ